jgi:hypothetical protein
MPEAGKDCRLAVELAGVVFGREEIFLDCDLDSQVLVHGAVNCAHPTFTEYINNSVTVVEQRTPYQVHFNQ